MRHTLKAITISALLLFSSCEKEKSELDKLPPATQHGANTFGCLIDGEAFIPKDGKPELTFPVPQEKRGLVVNEYSSYFEVLAFDRIDKNGMFFILKRPLIKQRVLPISTNNGGWNTSYIKDTSNISYSNIAIKYYNTYSNCGEIYVSKYDTVDGVYSGWFEFSAVDEETRQDTIQITNGRFDLSLK